MINTHSLLTEAGDPKKLIRTTYWTRFDQSIRDDEHENLEKVVEGASNGKGSSDEDVGGGGGRGDAGVEEVKMSTIRDGKEDPKKNVDTSIEEEEEEEEEEDLCEDGCCRPKKEDDPENCHRRDCPKKVCAWFCGLDGDTSEANAKLNDHLEKLTCLEQDPKAKKFLNVNLVIILTLGFFLFIVFSIKGHWQLGFWRT